MNVYNRAGLRFITLFLSFMTVYLFLYTTTAPMGFNVESDDFFLESSCSCKTCVMDFMEDDWFVYRFNPTIPPLLNRRNSVLRKDIYKWWMGLQHSSLRINYTEVVDQMFSLFPDEDHYSDAGPDRCRTCAVVGNSGNLIGSHYGRLIDLHDFVIRINKGPTKGYEKDVGSRTTHRFMYPESAVDVDNSTHLVFSPFKILDMEWLISAFTTKNITRTYIKVRPSVNANRHMVMILHPAFIKYVHEIWLLKRGRYPSTGFLAIMFALHVCDQVSTFGFGADQYGNWYHYFEKTGRNLRTGAHSGSFEFDTMMRLYLEAKIQVYRGR